MSLPAMFEGIALGFSEIIGAPFYDATASWPGTPTYDAGGSITAPGTPEQYPCRAQFDAATQAMRVADGFLETDVRILVLSLERALDTAAIIEVATGEFAGKWQVLAPQRDPAGIGWECRGRRMAGAN